MRKVALLLTVALVGLVPAMTWAADATPAAPKPAAATAAPEATPEAAPLFSDAQRAEIENIIKVYLTDKNPAVMEQGIQTLQHRAQADADAKTKEGVSKSKDSLYNYPASPVGGNPKGDVTVVEFYDFNCGYCKMSEESVEKLLKEDKNVKFIYKDFPILGPMSVEASKAALASVKQGKFIAFHDALMGKKDHLTTSEPIYQTAKDVGLDVEKLKKDMNDPAITTILSDNMKLGQDIGVRGTPMFIVNDTVFPGAINPDELKKAVADARATAAKKP